jgi:ribosomal protein S18 acetylase RimI-like enzyme
MTEFEIRRYEPDDADRVWRVHEAAFRAAPIEFIEGASGDEELRDLTSMYLDGAGDFLVGERGKIVAIGGYKPVDERTIEIKRMRVHPDYQRRGYGRALLEALETRARKQDYEIAVLCTHVALDAAIQFYEASGYEETHREPHPVAGDTFVYYRRELSMG